MDKPKKCVIGFMNFKIKFVKEVPGDEHSHLKGLCDTEHQIIYISTSYPSETQRSSLMHEILHVCFYTYGITPRLKSSKIEEDIVTALTAPLMHALIENPQIALFVLGK